MLFSPSTYRQRLAEIKERMKKEGFDAILVADPANVNYVSGVWGLDTSRLNAVVIPAGGDCTMVAPNLEAELVESNTWINDVRVYQEWKKPYPPLVTQANHVSDVLVEKKVSKGTIGLELNSMNVRMYELIKEKLSKAVFRDASHIVMGLRTIKSPEEIKIMRRAAKIGSIVLEAEVQALRKPGVTEYEVVMAGREAGTKATAQSFGDDYLHTPLIGVGGVQIFVSGRRTSYAHGKPTVRKVQKGDTITPCGCLTSEYKGYHVTFGRTISVGKPSPEVKKLNGICAEASDEAVKAVRPGVKASKVYRRALGVFESSGYKDPFVHRLGRGVGLSWMEPPDLAENDDTILKPGMVFTLEPGIYLKGRLGLRVEDTVLVTETGGEELVKYPKDIITV